MRILLPEDVVVGRFVGDCPKCEWDLVVLQNSKTEKFFIGCSNFPECKYTETFAIDHPNQPKLFE